MSEQEPQIFPSGSPVLHDLAISDLSGSLESEEQRAEAEAVQFETLCRDRRWSLSTRVSINGYFPVNQDVDLPGMRGYLRWVQFTEPVILIELKSFKVQQARAGNKITFLTARWLLDLDYASLGLAQPGLIIAGMSQCPRYEVRSEPVYGVPHVYWDTNGNPNFDLFEVTKHRFESGQIRFGKEWVFPYLESYGR